MCFKENEPVLKQHLYSVRQKLQSTLTISSSTHTCGHSRGGGTSLTCGGALVCLELGLMRAVKWGQQLKRSVNTLFESCPPPHQNSLHPLQIMDFPSHHTPPPTQYTPNRHKFPLTKCFPLRPLSRHELPQSPQVDKNIH